MNAPTFLNVTPQPLAGPHEFHTLAFGNSMLPFLTPLSDLTIQPVPADRIRLGDVVTYRRQGSLCAHRVVKIVWERSTRRFVTKGDNRVQCDPAVSSRDVLGVVVRSGSRDLTRRSWRWAGVLLAWLSYGPCAVTTQLLRVVPRGKRFVLQGAALCQPLLVWNRVVGSRSPRSGPRSRAAGPRAEVRIHPAGDQPEEFVALWNRCVPDATMGVDFFLDKIHSSPWFSPAGCWVATQGTRVVGVVLASDRKNRSGVCQSPGVGFIEWLGVDPSCRALGIGSALLDQAIQSLRRRGCRRFRTGFFRTRCDGNGRPAFDRPIRFFAKRGFDLETVGQAFRLRAARWDRAMTPRLLHRLAERGGLVRLATPEDWGALRHLFRPWGTCYDPLPREGPPHPGTLLVSTVDGAIRGFCHVTLWEPFGCYGHPEWVWPESRSPGVALVGHLRVEPAYRSWGFGAALSALAFDTLFAQGCTEARAGTALPGLQARLLRWGLDRLGAVVDMALE